MTNTTDIEQKIIESAITCIERFGLRDTTVRRIAQEAGVNVAAINYYFRSKEQLMERVMETTLDNAFDWSHFASSEDYTPKQRLADILDHMTKGAQMFPEITRAHFIAPILERKDGSVMFGKCGEFMERVYEDLVKRGAEPGPELRQAVIQAFSSTILGVGIFLNLYADFPKVDYRDPETRRNYIESIVDSLL